MDYYSINVSCTDDHREALMAWLSRLPFETFEETASGFNAYVPAPALGAEVESALAELQQTYAFTYTKQYYPAENWNQVWESNFQPVWVEDFCGIRAEFHPDFGGRVQYELVIQPKMAFGTGHHDTTWLCIRKMKNLPIAGRKLLDYGCGTGILAILAAKMGAASIDALDIEREACLNTLENARRNGVESIVTHCGTLEQVQGSMYDGVLANINRNVIVSTLSALYAMISTGGWLLVSGILLDDAAIVSRTALEAGFQLQESGNRNEWMYLLFEK